MIRFLFILSLIVVTMITVAPAAAQADRWCYYINFEEENGAADGWTKVSDPGGTYIDDVGWVGTTHIGNEKIAIEVAFTTSVVTLIAADLYNNAPTQNHSELWEDDEIVLNTSDPVDGYTEWTGNVVASSVKIDLEGNAGSDTIIRAASIEGIGDSPFGEDNCDDDGGGGLYEPLAAIDPQFGIWDYATLPTPSMGTIPSDPLGSSYPDENLVIAMSQNIGDLVYAVAPGEVLYVRRLTSNEDCFLNYTIRCVLSIDVARYLNDGEYHEMLAYQVNLSSIYKVGVAYGDNVIEYFVEDAPRYVSVGISILAGCIIGKTTELSTSSILEDWLIEIGLDVELDFTDPETFRRGAAFLQMIDEEEETLPLRPLLTEPVVPGAACNADPSLAACIGDPELNNPDLWVTQGLVQWIPGGGAILQRAASIKLGGLNLNSSVAYTLSVTVRRVGDTGNIALRLGTTNLTNIALTLPIDQYEIPADTHTADQSPLYSAQITNTGQTSIEVLSFCVTDGTASERPNTCYFQNYSFDDGISHWEVSGSVVPGFSGSEIAMPDGSTISQNVRLYPDGAEPHNYELYVIAKLTGGSADDMTSTAQFLYQFPDGEGFTAIDSPASTTSYSFGLFHLWPNREVLFSVEVPISAITEGNFSIGYEETRGEGATGVITVKEVCLNDPFSHHPVDRGGQPPFRPVCSAISVPTTDDIGEWIFYHWSQLDRFFQCDLMIVLNRIFSTAYATYEFVQWQTLYWQAVASTSINWGTKDLIGWLGGHFANMAYGRTTTIISGGSGTCSDIGCIISQLIALLGQVVAQVVGPIVAAIGDVIVIFGEVVDILGDIVAVLLQLLNAAFSLLFVTINGLLTLIFGLITVILNFFSNFIRLIESLGTAVNNATPRPIPGVPQCQLDPQSSSFCVILWVAENTIFSGIGALLIPLIIGVLAIQVIGWSISFIKKNLANMGNSV